jgi:ABC-type uncharacterized transport system involved in gliding motility auxiliary subunit
MSASRYALVVFLALIVLFAASNIVVSRWFADARLDLTQNRLYSLSQGTKETLARLNEPVTFTFFYSRDAAADDPALRAYAGRVRELLQSYARASRGRVRVLEVEPVRFTEAEDSALNAGIVPLDRGPTQDPVFLGVQGANAVDEQIAIPQLRPERETFLEYELTRLVAELQEPTKARVGLITAMPWDPAVAALAPQPTIITDLARFADVTVLARDFTEIPADVEILALLHPWPLDEGQRYAVDQFLMNKGRALVAVDPAALTADGAMTTLGEPAFTPNSSSLAAFFTVWGLSLSPDVVLDGEGAVEVQALGPDGRPAMLPHPLLFRTPVEQIDRDDLVTSGLSRGMIFGAPGALVWSPVDGVTITPLVRTSGATMRFPAADALAQPQPMDVIRRFTPMGRQETLAVRLNGRIKSAFGAAPPPGAASDAEHLAEAVEDATIVVVADVDFLTDGFFVDPQSGSFADNGAFVLNTMDQLAGSTALLSLRARAPSARRLDRVDAIRRAAQAEMAESEEALREELARTEQQLRALRSRDGRAGYFAGALGEELTADEQAEMARFTQRALEIRRDLRAQERGVRARLEQLEGRLIALNVWAPPLLVAAIGIALAWRRRRKTSISVAVVEAEAERDPLREAA